MNADYNIITSEETKLKFKHAINMLYNTIKKSYGPLASNTMIVRPNNSSFTKDGITIINNLRSPDVNLQEILSIFKGLSTGVNSAVGDGTTSTIVLLKHCIDEFETYFEERCKREDIDIHPNMVDDVRSTLKYIIDSAKEYSHQVKTVDEVLNIASVSLNNNRELMNIIKEVYQTDEDLNNSITVNIGYSNQVNRLNNAYSVSGRLTSGSFGNTVDGKLQFENMKLNDNEYCPIRLLLLDGEIVNNEQLSNLSNAIKNVCEKEVQMNDIKRTIIITPRSVPIFRDYMAQLVQLVGVGKMAFIEGETITQEALSDLGLFTGVDVIKSHRNSDLDDIKTIEDILNTSTISQNIISVTANAVKTVIEVDPNVNNKKSTDLDNRMKQLNLVLNESDMDIVNPTKYESAQLAKKRLVGKLTEVTIGSVTAEDTSNNKLALEDCTNAIEKSLKHGYNVGQNLLIPSVLNKLELNMSNDSEFIKISRTLKIAYEKAFNDILKGFAKESIFHECITNNKCYNPIDGKYVTNIINPNILDTKILEVISEGIRLFFDTNQCLGSTYDTTIVYGTNQ